MSILWGLLLISAVSPVWWRRKADDDDDNVDDDDDDDSFNGRLVGFFPTVNVRRSVTFSSRRRSEEKTILGFHFIQSQECTTTTPITTQLPQLLHNHKYTNHKYHKHKCHNIGKLIIGVYDIMFLILSNNVKKWNDSMRFKWNLICIDCATKRDGVRSGGWLIERTNEWMNECMHEWMDKQLKEWMKKRKNEWNYEWRTQIQSKSSTKVRLERITNNLWYLQQFRPVNTLNGFRYYYITA